MVGSKMVDKRNPEKLYERIKEIQKSNPNMKLSQAADVADEEYKRYTTNANGHGKI